MRIAQVSTLAAPVRGESDGQGSVEGLVWTLTEHLVQRGHEVTVFGAAGSNVAGELVATLPGPYGEDGAPDDWQLCEWINLCEAIQQSRRFDVLHSHAYLWGLPLEPLSSAPMVHTLHVWPYDDSVGLRRAYPDASVVAPSRAQWAEHPDLAPAAVVPHGIDPEAFPASDAVSPLACYLGRFIPGKGPLEAIAATRDADVPLVMAGPSNDYFEEEVAGQVDGQRVEYVGPVSGPERAAFLGSAGVLVAPLQAPEPFSLVLVEAMMCGTPVVAMAVGAAPEVVDTGVTGYCADRAEDLPALIQAALELDRRQVRARAQERYSVDRMVEDHYAVYEKVAAG